MIPTRKEYYMCVNGRLVCPTLGTALNGGTHRITRVLSHPHAPLGWTDQSSIPTHVSQIVKKTVFETAIGHWKQSTLWVKNS